MSDIPNARLATMVALVERKHPLGRTAVMKLCYFLQTLRNVPLGYRFTLYSYGPFDANVLSDISSAEALGGIQSKTVFYPGGYGYEISPAGNSEFVKSLASDFVVRYGADLDWVIQQFGEFGSADLELLSTIVYVDRETSQAQTSQSPDTLSKQVHEIKPHFDVPYVQSKVKYLDQQDFLSGVNAAPAQRSAGSARREPPMQVRKTQGEVGPDGRLRLDVPVELPAGAVELVLVVGSTPQPNGSKYNFADVVGKLQWQGDALEEQRKLRDE